MADEVMGWQRGDATPEGRLSNDLGNLAAQWEEIGIDPDDFLKCAGCHEFMFDEDGRPRDCRCDREGEDA